MRLSRSDRTGTTAQLQLQFLVALVLLFTGIAAFVPGGLLRSHASLPTLRRPLPLSTRRVMRKQQIWLRPATVTLEDKPAGPSVSIKASLVSASALVVLDVAFRRLLKSMSIAFPSSLAGCGVLFASMLTLPFGGRIYDALSPGSTLLTRWLAVMFVPSLVTLPLADGLGSAAEFLKVALVIVGGFYFTLLTTSGSVLVIRRLFSPKTALVTHSLPLEEITEDDEPVSAASSDTDPPPKPFSKELVTSLRVLKACSGGAAAVACRSTALAPLEAPLTTAFLLFATLHGFVFGARLPKQFTKFVHPLVTCTSITWLSAKLLGLVNGCSFAAMLGRYKTGKLPPAGTGAGDLLLFLLGPAVMSLACQMYDRRKLMKENLAEVATAVGVSSFGGLFGTAAAVRLLEIGSPSVRLSLLSRNITSPLAMAIAKILGADVSLAVSMVVMTGLIGANFGASSLDAFGIKDAVARGLGIGAAAHGLGTAAFSNEEDAFPFAAIAMALTASSCTVLVSIPVIKKMVLQLALGW